MLLLTLNSSIIGKRDVVGNSDVKYNSVVMVVMIVYINNNKIYNTKYNYILFLLLYTITITISQP